MNSFSCTNAAKSLETIEKKVPSDGKEKKANDRYEEKMERNKR